MLDMGSFIHWLVKRLRSKLKRDSILIQSELIQDGQISAADVLLQQKEEEIRKMKDMLSKMQHQLQQRSKSLGEIQLKRDFSLANSESKQEVRL